LQPALAGKKTDVKGPYLEIDEGAALADYRSAIVVVEPADAGSML
jgi:hypothetical protein